LTVTLEDTPPNIDQVIGNDATASAGGIIEPDTQPSLPPPHTLDPDYAIIQLASPMRINASSYSFHNPIYGGLDSALLGQSLTCVGYGFGALSTGAACSNVGFATGLNTMRTASLAPNNVTGGFYTYPLTGGQVGAGGDSGSTCFTAAGQVTTVQSTCAGTGADIDCRNGVTNNEWNSITSCQATAPSTIRPWAQPITHATIHVSYTFQPEVAGVVYGTATTPNSGPASFSATSAAAITDYAVRSGWYDVTITEPPQTLCTHLSGITPLTGSLDVHGACLSDGLLPVILS
jgi:hypothetical protein